MVNDRFALRNFLAFSIKKLILIQYFAGTTLTFTRIILSILFTLDIVCTTFSSSYFLTVTSFINIFFPLKVFSRYFSSGLAFGTDISMQGGGGGGRELAASQNK
jgi:hypothetical protein